MPVLLVQSPAPLNRETLEGLKALKVATNEFCWAMHDLHGDKPDYQEAYQEAYELLQLANTMMKADPSGVMRAKIEESLKEFDSEIHHVENHVVEFAGPKGDKSSRKLEEVEAALHRVMKIMGLPVKHAEDGDDGHDHKHGTGEHPVDEKERAAVAAEVANLDPAQLAEKLEDATNQMCWSMHKRFQDKADFTEAYQEAYELLQLSKQIRKALGTDQKEAIEQLKEFASEIHHVEHHVVEFVGEADEQKRASDVTIKTFEGVEHALLRMLVKLGISLPAAADHEHEAPADPVAQQTLEALKTLSKTVYSFCKAMKHNYTKNPGYDKAYADSYALVTRSNKLQATILAGGISEVSRNELAALVQAAAEVKESIKTFSADDDPRKLGPARLGRKFTEIQQAIGAIVELTKDKQKPAEESKAPKAE